MANDDKDLDRLISTGKAALADSDATPADVADLARNALSFRDIPVVPTTPADELVGVRSAALAEAHRVTHGESSLLWSWVEGTITGMLDSDTVMGMKFHTVESTTEVELDFIGTFELEAPGGAYRFIVEDAGGPWATDWHN
ncbi:MAG: hypothetical protein ACR2P0_14890 [Acidimicrobiales bacterium]